MGHTGDWKFAYRERHNDAVRIKPDFTIIGVSYSIKATMALERAFQCSAGEFFRNDEERETFLRRLKRACKKPIHQASAEEFLGDALKVSTADDFPFSVANLEPYAEQGSRTAEGLLQSAIRCVIGRQALADFQVATMATVFADVYRMNSLVVQWDAAAISATRFSLSELIRDKTQTTKIRGDALFVMGNLSFLTRDFAGGLKQVRMAQRLIPDDGYLHANEGCILAMQMKIHDALAAFQRATELGCEDIEHTLFHRAVLILKSEGADTTESSAIQLLEQYVDQAEPDARKLPEACYRLALMHAFKGPRHVGAAKRFLVAGEAADKSRLPFFQDEAHEWRQQARALVKHYQSCGNPNCNEAASKFCQQCEQISYCSRDCQVQHWRVHKKVCHQSKKQSAT